MIHYSTQSIDDSDLAAVQEVLRSDWLTQGPTVPRFEEEFAKRHATAHAIAVCNATSALHIACLALGAGPGKRVWTSPISFVASSNCALYCGAAIDFVDIDPRTRNMSIARLEEKLRHAEKNGQLPHIVIPVHFTGEPCDMAAIKKLADQYGFKLLADASHATGASYQGQPIGSQYADISVFSFHPVKIITTAEGGMLTTQDAALATQLRLLRSHGIVREPSAGTEHGMWFYEQKTLGFNYRMTDLHAALGVSQLQRLEQFHNARLRLAARYETLLADLPVQRPCPSNESVSSWHLYAVEVPRRRHVFDHLWQAGIATNVHYIPIHTQPYYQQLGFSAGQFPAAEKYYEGALSLPLYPALSDEQQDFVVATLRDALR